MGKSDEGRGLFRRRSTPVEQDPAIDITSVLSAYGRTATLAPAAAPTVAVDDDTVRYAPGPEPVAELSDPAPEMDVDLTEDVAPVPTDVLDLAEEPADAEPETEPVAADEPVHLTDGEQVEETPEAEAVVEAAWTEAEAGAVEQVDLSEVADTVEPMPEPEPVATWTEPEAELLGQAEETEAVVEPTPEVEAAWAQPGVEAAWTEPEAVVEPTPEVEVAWAQPEAEAAWTEPEAEVLDQVDLAEHTDVAGSADVETQIPVLDVPIEDAQSTDPLSEPAEAIYASMSPEIPAPAGWWEDASSGWGPADHDQIDAVVHDSLPTADADTVPETLSPDEAYGHHADAVAHVEQEEPAVEAAAPVAWWQALQTDDLGGLPVAGPEQHDEQHDHHHETHPPALDDRLEPLDPSVPDHRPWWASLQDPAHDIPHEADVVDLREEPLSEEPEAVAARLARLRDAGLLSHEEYAAETASLLADRG